MGLSGRDKKIKQIARSWKNRLVKTLKEELGG